MTFVLRSAARTDIGRGPKQLNEDSGLAGPYLVAVADGMGGMVAGDVASALTIRTLSRLDPTSLDEPSEALRRAAREANERIARHIRTDPRMEGMGTTLTAGALIGDQLVLAHIGDSRAYLLRTQRLEQITHDHTFVQSLVDEGRLTPEEAAHHPHKALITRALQGGAESAPDLARIELQAGDRLLFCSDGLDNADLDDATIGEVLRTAETVEGAATSLVNAALDRGSPDNVTCVVADVIAEEEVSASTEPVMVGAAAELDELDEGLAEITMTRENLAIDEDAPEVDEEDEEELRYAPQPPKRFRWLRRTAFAVVVLGVIGTGLWAAYTWTQAQYYVGVSAGAEQRSTALGGEVDVEQPERLTIFRGIAQQVPGFELSDPVEVRDLDVRRLPTYHRELVEATISADDLEDAQQIVAELERVAAFCRQANEPSGDEPTEDPTDPNNPTDGPTSATPDRPRPSDEPTGNGPGQQDGAAPNALAPETTAETAQSPSTLDVDAQNDGLSESAGESSADVDDIPLNCGGAEQDPSETR